MFLSPETNFILIQYFNVLLFKENGGKDTTHQHLYKYIDSFNILLKLDPHFIAELRMVFM